MPRRVDHEVRRREIGEALLRIAHTKGLQSASMREVAAEAGVSLRLVQYYFQGKNDLLLAALAYLGEQLSARVEQHIRALGSPPTPAGMVYGTLTAILPTDEESRRITRTYTAYYTLVLAEPDLAVAHGATYPDALERFLARQLEAAGVSSAPDSRTVAAGLLALTNGLGSSVLGGQRDGDAALAVLKYHLDRLFAA
ncbi:TetR/AcrR family transcriptional regulator [Catellatospora tritici]|uniref:TetR/AcrR family transcriptional regulator n=1 Tax=Catellatospora tritici TaxID=2851566 RepID=UPI001C2CEA6C|nr:TetR/AcrR family transcriptional regulator [Catellatospora tritici]MBV1856192.1 TetR family transcriptional regulator C-terminal domain-containing protein [Catellatospora tritici]